MYRLLEGRRRGAAVLVGTALLLAVSGGYAVAEEESPPPAADSPTVTTTMDPLYILQNALMLLQGYQHDLTDPAKLSYLVQHILSWPGRTGESLANLLEPTQYQGPDGQQRLRNALQKVIDNTVHLLPTFLGTAIQPPDHRYLPDWNNNGVFGEVADGALDSDSPSVEFAGNVGLTANFRYPCTEHGDVVRYETRSGDCVSGDTPGADFKLGEARKIQIVNARGLRLAATLWLPEEALEPGTDRKFPMAVFSDGAVATQGTYLGWTTNAVRRGYVGLTYDQAGQGASDGTILDLVVPYNTPHCFASGACRDIEDVMRWVVGDDILPAPDTRTLLGDTTSLVNFWNTVHMPRVGHRYDPGYGPGGDNERNPVLDLIDTGRIGIWGQSMGSIATSHYLWDVGQGRGMDGRPLPKPAAAVLMSGFEPSAGFVDVPTQIQTADLDIPGLTSGGVFPVNDFDILGAHIGFDPTDGALGGKSWYDWERRNRTDAAPLQFLTFEGGSHFDTVGVGVVFPRALESWRNSITYGVDWLDCHIQEDESACARVVTPVPGLSRAVAAEVSPLGPGGPSYCMNTPDNQTLVTLLLGPFKALLSAIYGEPASAPCVAGRTIDLSPHRGGA